MFGTTRWVLVSVLVLGAGILGVAKEEKDKPKEGRLKLVESSPRADLDATVSLAVSTDGKFLYSASWKPATLVVFSRDAKSGKLEQKQTVANPDALDGTTSVSLSPDDRYVIASAFRSKTAVLYKRDAETGELTVADVARDGERDIKLSWPTEAVFSADSKFVHVLDDQSEGGEPNQGAVVTFKLNDGKLELVGRDTGKENCYSGARGIFVHPDGKTLFVASHQAGALVVADRDPKTGKTSVRQVVKDEEEGAHGLDGAMGVVASPDGRHVYVSSGRFHGDNAVSVFQLGTDGKLAFVQEMLNDQGDLIGFGGGNHLCVSPDGRNVYAAATLSKAVACFSRDPATGKLSYLETLPDAGEAGGDAGAAAVIVSPDGRFAYVATEDGKSISVFERNPE